MLREAKVAIIRSKSTVAKALLKSSNSNTVTCYVSYTLTDVIGYFNECSCHTMTRTEAGLQRIEKVIFRKEMRDLTLHQAFETLDKKGRKEIGR